MRDQRSSLHRCLFTAVEVEEAVLLPDLISPCSRPVRIPEEVEEAAGAAEAEAVEAVEAGAAEVEAVDLPSVFLSKAVSA